MTDNIDVQLHSLGLALVIPSSATDENLPGEVHLAYEEADDLRDLLNEAWLNRHGMQPVSVAWAEAGQGDVIPSLGKTLSGSPFATDDAETHGTVYFVGSGSLTLPMNAEITVHRRIA
jgi:hypothetical protein